MRALPALPPLLTRAQGTYLGTLQDVNHLDLVGWTNGARYKWAELMGQEIQFRPATFYLGVADWLAREVEGQREDVEGTEVKTGAAAGVEVSEAGAGGAGADAGVGEDVQAGSGAGGQAEQAQTEAAVGKGGAEAGRGGKADGAEATGRSAEDEERAQMAASLAKGSATMHESADGASDADEGPSRTRL